VKLTSPFIAALKHRIYLADELLPSPSSRVTVGTCSSGYFSFRQVTWEDRLDPLKLFPYLRSTAGEPPRRNTTAVIKLHHRRFGSLPFYPLRSTPTCTSPPARFALVPCFFLASFPSPPATLVAGI
jgi:hypothetical protein